MGLKTNKAKNMGKNNLSIFDKYFFGNGCATRKEFWCTFLFLMIFVFVAAYTSVYLFEKGSTEYIIFRTIIRLLNINIFVSVTIRRLHDIGKSGWWYLLIFTIVGIIPLLYWATIKGRSAEQSQTINPLQLTRSK